jgi:aspartate racemase
MKPFRIGILGGMSYESTIKYYKLILEKYYQIKFDYSYPEIIIFSLNFQDVIDLEHSNNKEKYVAYLMEGIRSLEQAGVAFIVMAANSPHAVYDTLIKLTKIPILSIVKATAERAAQEDLNNLLLLGIKFTMQSTFYQDYFHKLGIDVITPSNEEQDKINDIIFSELVLGNLTNESRQIVLQIIKNYNVDGVILGCTELPLLLRQEDSNIKLLDTVEIHVEAVIDYYLAQNKLH